MPMVVYTEEEVIEKCNEAKALGAERAAADRDRATAEVRRLRELLAGIVEWSVDHSDAVRRAKSAITTEP